MPAAAHTAARTRPFRIRWRVRLQSKGEARLHERHGREHLANLHTTILRGVLVKAQALANIQTDLREAADYNATALWARDELLWRGEVLDPNQCAFCRSALDTRGHCHDAECIRILSWRR